MDGERLVEAFRRALNEPPSIVERLQWLIDPGSAAEATALELIEEHGAVAARRGRRRPQGFRPDGTPVSAAEKRAAFALYEAKQAAHRERVAGGLIRNSASPREREAQVPTGNACPWW